MVTEIWKAIVDYEGLYEVSNFGNVRGLDRTVDTKTGKRKYKGMNIKPKKLLTGYLQVSVYKYREGKTRYFQPLIHQLVANAFLKKQYNQVAVNHIDGNKTNNRLDNLEYCTDSDNELHKYRVVINKKRGAYLNRSNNRYYSQLRYKGALLGLGEYDTIEEAYDAYYKKYKELYNKEPWYHKN